MEVREAIAYVSALTPTKEVVGLFPKCALFSPSESTIKKIANQVGECAESQIDTILETIREQKEIPLKEVRAVAVSRDGVNVLMQEPGKTKGRKRQHSGERKTATEGEFNSPTSYKNAVVGSVTLYGAIPPDEVAPERLQSRYVAQMPEDKAVALKNLFTVKTARKGISNLRRKKDTIGRRKRCGKYLSLVEVFRGELQILGGTRSDIASGNHIFQEQQSVHGIQTFPRRGAYR
ncbi:MAG: hypothetical protein LBT05_06460 [Planctomycetaceae bacterium]|nr:hypothetical protein [Planctomycetaceae bacterium]